MTTITLDTPLTGDAIGTLAQLGPVILESVDPAFTASMNAAIFTLAPKANLRGDIVVARSALETANWRSELFKKYRNPGGLAAFPDGTYVGGTFTSPVIAAKAMLAHFVAYVYGESINDDTAEWAQYDPRWHEALKLVKEEGTIGQVGQFGNGMWATSETDAVDLVTRFNDLFDAFTLPAEGGSGIEVPPVTETITFGRVPLPALQQRFITKPEGIGQNNLGKRTVKGVVWHRMIGTLRGTDGYFRLANVAALTDYGIGVAATDGAADDGVILQWNDPQGYQSGWASGPVNGAYGDGQAFLAKYGASNIGVNVVNRDQASIEISGNYDTPISAKAFESIAALTAYWADQYRIPYDVFPIAPQDGFSFVRYHQEFTIGTGKVCPGAVVIAQTEALIERARAILKRYQVSTATTTTPAPPKPVPTTPAPTPDDDITLPKGLSWQLVARLFNPNKVTDPDSGKVVAFSRNAKTHMAWLATMLDSIPKGKPWTEGDFGPLVQIVRRGDGGRVYQFVGFTHEVGPAKDDAA